MEFIFGLIVVIVLIVVVRLFGAWMLRIDEIIRNQKEILKEMKRFNFQNKKD